MLMLPFYMYYVIVTHLKSVPVSSVLSAMFINERKVVCTMQVKTFNVLIFSLFHLSFLIQCTIIINLNIYLKPLKTQLFIYVGFLINCTVMFKTVALFQATCRSYETLLTEVGLSCSLLSKILVKTGKNIKFPFDVFKNFKFHQILVRRCSLRFQQ